MYDKRVKLIRGFVFIWSLIFKKFYKHGDAGPRPPHMEYCSMNLVHDGSNISLIIRVLINIWCLILLSFNVLLYVCMYISAEEKNEKVHSHTTNGSAHCTPAHKHIDRNRI